MARWEPDSAGRLARAALDLYVERGFEQTTVAEIAQRAGLTERTFFRHFADKREVLFGGTDQLKDALVTAVRGAPEGAAPMEALEVALVGWADSLADRRKFVLKRHAVVAANPELQERELIKLSSLASAMADALRDRGVADPAALLAAEAGMAVFRVAFERWVHDRAKGDLGELIRRARQELRVVTAEA